MATNGKLEAKITVPTGGWTATVGGNTATIAAGDYYWSSAADFASAIATAFTAAAGFAVSVSTATHGEGGTGIITLSAGSAFTVAWVSTDLRDIMGYTGNLSSGTSHVAPKAVRALWIPVRPKWAPSGNKNFKGWPISDQRHASNAGGLRWVFVGQSKVELPLRWSFVPKARVVAADETTGNQSFERFWRDSCAGSAGWGANPCAVRFYPDAADDATYGTYWITNLPSFKPGKPNEDWDGMYTIELLLEGIDQ